MKSKKGFTMVELLAVIAILAILVLIVLPNVLEMFRKAKKSSFIEEAQTIYTTAQKTFVASSMNNSQSNNIYSSTSNKLDMSGRKLDYCVYTDQTGRILQMTVSSNEYYMIYDGEKKIEEYDFNDAYDMDETYEKGCGINVNVSFDSNGGKEELTSKTVIYNLKYGSLPSTTKDYYKFVGWFTEKVGGEEITSTSKVTNKNNHTLYAHWTGADYTVTYDPNTGSVSPTSGVQQYESNYKNLPTPKKENYIFDGWFTEKEGGTQVTTSTKVTNPQNHTLYAHWSLKSIATATIDKIENQTYTGSEITPEVNVTLEGKVLTKNTDYIIKYENNVDVGTANIKITGTGKYDNEVSTTFDIVQAEGKVEVKYSNQIIAENGYPIETNTVTTNISGGKISVKSNSKKVSVSVSGNTITWIGSGSTSDNASITVTSEATKNYKEASTTFTVSYKRTKFFDEDLGNSSEYSYHYSITSWGGPIKDTYKGGTFYSRSYNSLKQSYTTGEGGDFMGARLKNLETGHSYTLSGTVSQNCSSGVMGSSDGYNNFYLTYRINKWTQTDSSGSNGHYGWAFSDPWRGNGATAYVWCSNPTGNTNNSFACNAYNKSSASATYSISLTFTAKNVNDNYIYWDAWGCKDWTTFTANMYNLKLKDNTRGVIVRGGN